MKNGQSEKRQGGWQKEKKGGVVGGWRKGKAAGWQGGRVGHAQLPDGHILRTPCLLYPSPTRHGELVCK